MELIDITQDGVPARPVDALPDIVADVMAATSEMYKATGYRPPWIGYLALDNGECVGTCAFKTPPAGGRVEIAYFTFPGHEGRGVATAMARHLLEKALTEPQPLRICAQTLPEHNASTRVLEKLGFQQIAEFDHPEDGRVWEWEWKAQPCSGPNREPTGRAAW
jgi:[ribosomal protein S5]-alanine N-acetyltransferase